ncbi:MAG: hypothetical protein ACJAZP_000904 [Psychromonas sp.]|jgi:hypothetical protein|uniref:RES family NAD+ phosphorylase n=1 Tax=Psychromonas sp. TaxID=1884585 RepID=UPI0039E44D9A
MIARTLLEIGELQRFNADVTRIVETQEYAATTSIVDDLDEQSLLEELLDEVKPDHRKGAESLHYLISTPFRYPPLKHGSRFGDVTMPSYFYASEDVKTALSECAFYRFVFLDDMSVPYNKPIKSEHMSFSVNIDALATADLTKVESKDIVAALVSPVNYIFTQQLGKYLTQIAGATALRFYSARAKENKGVNIAVTHPDVIISKKPENNVNWICHTTIKKISFNAHENKPISFHIDSFLINGVLPKLA